MDNIPHKSFSLPDRSYSSLLKKEVRKEAERIGLSSQKISELDIIVAEIASNLIKHTPKGGEVLVKEVEKNGQVGIEIISIDNGPGVSDMHKVLEDGVSTSNTLGQGLGAIKRLSDDFEFFSHHGWGTILVSRVFPSRDKVYINPQKSLEVTTIMVAKPGETKCGDGWGFKNSLDKLSLIATDGLGHGPEANHASEEAIKAFKNFTFSPPSDSLREVNENIRKTRGIVGAVINIDPLEKKINFCGIGNISGRLFSNGGTKSLVSYNGIIGLNIPRQINNHEFDFNGTSLIVLTSDGIKTRWEIPKFLNFLRQDSTVIAASIYKDFGRKTDDTLVVVIKN